MLESSSILHNFENLWRMEDESSLCLLRLFNSLKSVSFNLHFCISPSFLSYRFNAFRAQLKDHLIYEILSSRSGDADDSNL